MTNAKVTVAIPTYNRADMLEVTLASVLRQDFPDFKITVLDNASTDGTEMLVRSVSDARVEYVRNPGNLGLFRNWKRAVEINTSEYLCLLPDDDVLLPGFLAESVAALDRYRNAGFSTVRARAIDIHGAPIDAAPADITDASLLDVIADLQNPYPMPGGLLDGLEYLHGIEAGKKWITHVASMLMRADVVRRAGGIDNPLCKGTIDLNLLYRLASIADVVVIPRVLCEVRFHPAQETQLESGTRAGLNPLAVLAERNDAIVYLMQSSRAAEPFYRNWLAEQLLTVSLARSTATEHIVPALNCSWSERLETARQDIELLIPASDLFILADANALGTDFVTAGRRAIPFLEQANQYWGPPKDDDAGIREIERQRAEGARFLVFAWPAFWWLDFYGGMRDYLYANYDRLARNSRMVVFDLKNRKSPGRTSV